MGLFSWFKRRAEGAEGREAPVCGQVPQPAPAGEEWELVPAFLPVDAHDHPHVCAIATAIAAGDRPTSTFTVTGVSVVNPEHRRVSIIASALAAGALEHATLAVRNVYKQKALEENHAA